MNWYLNVLKNRKVKNIDISKFIWEPINNTTQVYDFKITESVNPANATIIEEFRKEGIFQSDIDVKDSKKIWVDIQPTWAVNYQPDSPFNNNTQMA